MPLTKRTLVVGALFAVIGACPVAARADDKSACIAANELGQKLRDEHELLASRAQFLACAKETCPAALAKDCFEQLGDLEKRTPSIVVRAHDPKGRDLVAVRLSIDGTVASESLDGKAIVLDPGPHVLRLEAGGEEAVEQNLVLGEGEHARLVVVTIGKESPPEPSPSADKSEERAPLGLYVVGALGVASLGAGIAFYVAGYGERSSDIASGCATQAICDDQKSSVRTKLIVGDVLVGAGLVTIVTSAILLFRGSSEHAAATAFVPHVDAVASPRGGLATVAFAF